LNLLGYNLICQSQALLLDEQAGTCQMKPEKHPLPKELDSLPVFWQAAEHTITKLNKLFGFLTDEPDSHKVPRGRLTFTDHI